MAHFAKLNENNIVTAVHVVNNDVITIDGEESEQAGIDFLTLLHGHSLWKQTSFNANFRKNFAGIGYLYDQLFDAFIEPKPYDSWKLNHSTCRWEPPTPMPESIDGFIWKWSEYNKEWIQVAIPSEN